MSKATEVISRLAPGCVYNITGADYENIVFLQGTASFTKKQFDDAFETYDAWKAEQDAAQAAIKAAAQAKLAALGLTTDDLKALGL